MRKFLLSLFALGLLALPAQAQVATQQSGTQLTAGAVCQTIASPAVNTANTLTFTVPAGQYLYLTSVNVTGSGDSTGGAINNGRITTTNLQSVEWDFTFPSGTSAFLQIVSMTNPNGLIKSAQGPVSATIVSPQSTHTAYGMTACGYFAP